MSNSIGKGISYLWDTCLVAGPEPTGSDAHLATWTWGTLGSTGSANAETLAAQDGVEFEELRGD